MNPFKLKHRAIALSTLIFFTSSHLYAAPVVQTGNSNTSFTAQTQSFKKISELQVPKDLGTVQSVYRGKSDQTLLLIQDAHEIPEAQRNIEKLIEYLSSTYGVRSVMLEGASEKLDSQIFRSFPDQKRLRQVFEDYYERGELTGGTAAAIFSNVVSRESSVVSKTQDSRPKTDDLVFEGVEDWHLYEEGLELYQEALSKEKTLSEELRVKSEELRKEKEKIYSKELLEIDQAMEKFYENKSDLIETLKVLAKFEAPSGELALILKRSVVRDQSSGNSSVEIKRLAGEIEKLVKAKKIEDRKEKLEGNLTSNLKPLTSLTEFNLKKQSFNTSQISEEAYALYLTELAKKLGTGPRLPDGQAQFGPVPGLLKAAEEERRLQNIQGTKLFKDFEEYAQQTFMSTVRGRQSTAEKKTIMSKPWTMDRGLWSLVEETKSLRLLSKLIKLELTREEWQAFKKIENREEKLETADFFLISNFKLLTSHINFYKNAETREKAFLENIEKYRGLSTAYSELKRSTHDASRSTIVVAGGFHTEGLASALKSKNISYAVITPSISHLPSESFYREHMKGNVSWKNYFEVRDGKVNLYESFVRATRDQLISKSQGTGLKSQDVQPVTGDVVTSDPLILKNWRDQIIRDLAATNQIERAGSYTRFIDELRDGSRLSADAVSSSGEPSLAGGSSMLYQKAKQFIEGLKQLHSKKQLTEQNVLNLLRPSMTPTITAGVLTKLPIRINTLSSPTLRSELRSDEKTVAKNSANVSDEIWYYEKDVNFSKTFLRIWDKAESIQKPPRIFENIQKLKEVLESGKVSIPAVIILSNYHDQGETFLQNFRKSNPDLASKITFIFYSITRPTASGLEGISYVKKGAKLFDEIPQLMGIIKPILEASRNQDGEKAADSSDQSSPSTPRSELREENAFKGIPSIKSSVVMGTVETWSPEKRLHNRSFAHRGDAPLDVDLKVLNEKQALVSYWKDLRTLLLSEGIHEDVLRIIDKRVKNAGNQISARNQTKAQVVLMENEMPLLREEKHQEILERLANSLEIRDATVFLAKKHATQAEKIKTRQKEQLLIHVFDFVLNLPYGLYLPTNARDREKNAIKSEERGLASARRAAIAKILPVLVEETQMKGKSAHAAVAAAIRKTEENIKKWDAGIAKKMKQAVSNPEDMATRRGEIEAFHKNIKLDTEQISYLETLATEYDSFGYTFDEQDDEFVKQQTVRSLQERHAKIKKMAEQSFIEDLDAEDRMKKELEKAEKIEALKRLEPMLLEFDELVNLEIAKGRTLEYAAAKFLSAKYDSNNPYEIADVNLLDFMMRYYDLASSWILKQEALESDDSGEKEEERKGVIIVAEYIRDEADYLKLLRAFRGQHIIGIVTLETPEDKLRAPHWLLFAEKRNIQALAGLKLSKEEFKKIPPKTTAIIAGHNGEFILNPSQATQQAKMEIKKNQSVLSHFHVANALMPAQFLGHDLPILLDETDLLSFMEKWKEVGVSTELSEAASSGASGVGLLRLEEMIRGELSRQGIELDMDRLALALTLISINPFFTKSPEMSISPPLTVRMFDFAPDKWPAFLRNEEWKSHIPYLLEHMTGCRFYLSKDPRFKPLRDFAKQQLKAIFIAHLHKYEFNSGFRILFPDVRNAVEVAEIEELIEEAKKEFLEEINPNNGILGAFPTINKFSQPDAQNTVRDAINRIPIGYMIEDEETVQNNLENIFLEMDLLKAHQPQRDRFIGIGTNDLMKSIVKMDGNVDRRNLNPLMVQAVYKITQASLRDKKATDVSDVHTKEPEYGVAVEGEWGHDPRMLLCSLFIWKQLGFPRRLNGRPSLIPVSAKYKVPELKALIRKADQMYRSNPGKFSAFERVLDQAIQDPLKLTDPDQLNREAVSLLAEIQKEILADVQQGSRSELRSEVRENGSAANSPMDDEQLKNFVFLDGVTDSDSFRRDIEAIWKGQAGDFWRKHHPEPVTQIRILNATTAENFREKYGNDEKPRTLKQVNEVLYFYNQKAIGAFDNFKSDFSDLLSEEELAAIKKANAAVRIAEKQVKKASRDPDPASPTMSRRTILVGAGVIGLGIAIFPWFREKSKLAGLAPDVRVVVERLQKAAEGFQDPEDEKIAQFFIDEFIQHPRLISAPLTEDTIWGMARDENEKLLSVELNKEFFLYAPDFLLRTVLIKFGIILSYKEQTARGRKKFLSVVETEEAGPGNSKKILNTPQFLEAMAKLFLELIRGGSESDYRSVVFLAREVDNLGGEHVAQSILASDSLNNERTKFFRDFFSAHYVIRTTSQEEFHLKTLRKVLRTAEEDLRNPFSAMLKLIHSVEPTLVSFGQRSQTSGQYVLLSRNDPAVLKWLEKNAGTEQGKELLAEDEAAAKKALEKLAGQDPELKVILADGGKKHVLSRFHDAQKYGPYTQALFKKASTLEPFTAEETIKAMLLAHFYDELAILFGYVPESPSPFLKKMTAQVEESFVNKFHDVSLLLPLFMLTAEGQMKWAQDLQREKLSLYGAFINLRNGISSPSRNFGSQSRTPAPPTGPQSIVPRSIAIPTGPSNLSGDLSGQGMGRSGTNFQSSAGLEFLRRYNADVVQSLYWMQPTWITWMYRNFVIYTEAPDIAVLQALPNAKIQENRVTLDARGKFITTTAAGFESEVDLQGILLQPHLLMRVGRFSKAPNETRSELRSEVRIAEFEKFMLKDWNAFYQKAGGVYAAYDEDIDPYSFGSMAEMQLFHDALRIYSDVKNEKIDDFKKWDTFLKTLEDQKKITQIEREELKTAYNWSHLLRKSIQESGIAFAQTTEWDATFRINRAHLVRLKGFMEAQLTASQRSWSEFVEGYRNETETPIDLFQTHYQLSLQAHRIMQRVLQHLVPATTRTDAEAILDSKDHQPTGFLIHSEVPELGFQPDTGYFKGQRIAIISTRENPEDFFKAEPQKILTAFRLAAERKAFLDSDLIEAARRQLKTPQTKKTEQSIFSTGEFFEFLYAVNNPDLIDVMYEIGLLDEIIPPLKGIRWVHGGKGHRYPAGVHTMHLFRVLFKRLDSLPSTTEIYGDFDNNKNARKVLLLAILIHDAAKSFEYSFVGTGGTDHSIQAANEIVPTLLKNLDSSFPPKLIRLLQWLVNNHSVLVGAAQSIQTNEGVLPAQLLRLSKDPFMTADHLGLLFLLNFSDAMAADPRKFEAGNSPSEAMPQLGKMTELYHKLATVKANPSSADPIHKKWQDENSTNRTAMIEKIIRRLRDRYFDINDGKRAALYQVWGNYAGTIGLEEDDTKLFALDMEPEFPSQESTYQALRNFLSHIPTIRLGVQGPEELLMQFMQWVHAKKKGQKGDFSPAIRIVDSSENFQNFLEITVAVPTDYAGMLFQMAAIFSDENFNLHDSQIRTIDGVAFNTFRVYQNTKNEKTKSDFRKEIFEKMKKFSEVNQMQEVLDFYSSGQYSVMEPTLIHLAFQTDAHLYDPAYSALRVSKISDRVGIIRDIAGILSHLKIQIVRVEAFTYQNGIDDLFYLVDSEGKPLKSGKQLEVIEAIKAQFPAKYIPLNELYSKRSEVREAAEQAGAEAGKSFADGNVTRVAELSARTFPLDPFGFERAFLKTVEEAVSESGFETKAFEFLKAVSAKAQSVQQGTQDHGAVVAVSENHSVTAEDQAKAAADAGVKQILFSGNQNLELQRALQSRGIKYAPAGNNLELQTSPNGVIPFILGSKNSPMSSSSILSLGVDQEVKSVGQRAAANAILYFVAAQASRLLSRSDLAFLQTISNRPGELSAVEASRVNGLKASLLGPLSALGLGVEALSISGQGFILSSAVLERVIASYRSEQRIAQAA